MTCALDHCQGKKLGKAWSETPECVALGLGVYSLCYVPVSLSVKLRILSGEMEGIAVCV